MAMAAPDRDNKMTPGHGPAAAGASGRSTRAHKLREINLILADSARLSVTRKAQGGESATKQGLAPAPRTSARQSVSPPKSPPKSPRKSPRAAGGPEFTFLQLADFKRLDEPASASDLEKPVGTSAPEPPAAGPDANPLAAEAAGGQAAGPQDVSSAAGATGTTGATGTFASKSVAMSRLHSSRLRARRPYDKSAIEALASSLDRGRWRQPILVRPHPLIVEDYEIVVGELPFQAARSAGLDCLPVVVCRLSDHRALECVLLEDVQRTDLAPLEIAIGYGQLIRSFDFRLADLARLTGRSERQVAEVLLLLDPPKVSPPGPDNSRPDATGRKPSSAAAGPTAGPAAGVAAGAAKPSLHTEMAALERHLSSALGLKVEMSARGRRGAMQISFADLEQLECIARHLSSFRARPRAGSKSPGLAA